MPRRPQRRQQRVGIKPKSRASTAIMRGVRSRNTAPEVTLRRHLRSAGFRGYRLHWPVAGRPDVCYPGRRIAIFVHGCFWHGCDKCGKQRPRYNAEFWAAKLQENRARDASSYQKLHEADWTVFVVWECDIAHDTKTAIAPILNALRATEGADSRLPCR